MDYFVLYVFQMSALPAREVFTNGKPEGWGESKIKTSDGSEFDRKASVHEHTKMPLGVGCRWERSVLDKLEFPVYAFSSRESLC